MLPWAELTSIHGGPIASDRGIDGAVTTRRAVYEINGELAEPDSLELQQVQRGYLRVSTSRSSIFYNWIKGFGSLLRREGKIN